MRRTWWWTVVLIVGIMAGVMVVGRRAQEPRNSYATFTSQPLKVRFDYPSDWHVREIPKPGGLVVGEVQVFGPRREDLKYSLYVDVAAESVQGAALSPSGLEAAVQAWLAHNRTLPSYEVLEQNAVRCAGRPAIRVLMAYTLSLPLDAADRTRVAFQEFVTFCLRDGQLFRLTYAAPIEDFNRHQHAFDRLVKSFTFLP